jgi:tetratricopeptide (TPR) repeat protein
MKNLLLACLVLGTACRQENKTKSLAQLPAVTGCMPLTTDADWFRLKQKAPLLDGLGSLHYPISTTDSIAQKYFDQGLILAYGFNHAEAARSFYTAIQIDSTCAMCHWGFAYVLGPNYNAQMEPDNYERAWTAIQKAMALAASGSQTKEQDLIRVMASRYAANAPDSRAGLDSIYSAGMKSLHAKYADDPEIAALYAESIMDLHPWDLWDKAGQPKSWTPAIINAIEGLLKKFPDHPGFHHFYIHAMEASFTPAKGLTSARKFDAGMVPNAGHLVHMPSHIYIRTGDYHAGSLSNLRAVEVDSAYISTCHAQGAYPLAYFPHNYHFLAATATLEGKTDWALMAAHKLRSYTATELLRDPAWATLQHYYLVPYHILVKFGKWDDILNMPETWDELPYVNATRQYARGMAFLGKQNLAEAQKALDKLDSIAQDSSLARQSIWGINSLAQIVEISKLILRGELSAANQNLPDAITILRQAIALEDQLNYNEPPDWFFSVRHHLGAILLDANELTAAEKIYQEDLQTLPKNGWALHGLLKVYEAKKDAAGIQKTKSNLQEVWRYADIKLNGSRIL